ncbi:relaxase/mobilization nuclease domain-containing protein [Leptolyngbya ohadii]|uniref:relaxase/mobilization nuclease domain-containing protein n=1 Tax=Leptolyngbya ohadii TaxID=1962290 RepID=UPI0015C5A7F7|nr:relaxase/mobilization nuclease domain-containing protein [Leptolyngbya ohadii]
MIGKTTLSHSFEATLRYVYSKPNVTTIDATLTAAFTEDPLKIAEAMSVVARDRSPKPCYHISLSPSQNDHLDTEDWHQISADFLSGLGAETHQAVAVLHTDATYPDGTVRPHLHFVINRFESINSDARALCLHFPHIEKVIRKLERDYALESIPCSWEADRRGDAASQYHRTQRDGVPSVRTQVQESIDQTIAQATTVDEFLRGLQGQGIQSNLAAEGISFEQEGISFAGYQLGKAYTRSHVEKVLGRNSTMLQSDAARSGMSMADLMQKASEGVIPAPEAEESTSPAPKVEEIPLVDPHPEPQPQTESQPNRKPREPVVPSPLLAETGTALENLGQTIGGGHEIDGMMLGGAATQLAGAAVMLGDAFLKRIAEAKEREQSERAQRLIEQLEQVGQRTTALEETVQAQTQSRTTAAPAEPLTVATPSPTPASSTVSQPAQQKSFPQQSSTSPLAESFGLAQQRLEKLERQAGLPPIEYPALKFDHNASIDEQLDQMEAALKQINERLEKLEIVLQPEATVVTNKPTAEQVAESLANYVQARAQYYRLAPTEPVKTRTMGTIELSHSESGNDVIAVVERPFGAKFEATKQDGKWEVASNDLSDREIETIIKLPQTAHEYESVTQNKALVRYFQKRAPQEFEGEQGRIVWNDKHDRFNYRFDIATDRSGNKTVIGIDQRTEKVVMQAQIKSDGSIQVDRAHVPKEHTESLLHQQEATKSAESKVAQLHKKQRSRPELSL